PRLPITLDGTEVGIDGRQAPVEYVSPTQINVQVPFETETGNVEVFVKRAGVYGPPVRLPVTATSPAIFVIPSGGAVLKNNDFSVVSSSNPATTGDVLSIFCTGLGAVTPALGSGALAPGANAGTIPVTAATPTVTVGGVSADMLASVTAPGFAGVYQVIIRVPSGVPSGNQPLVITANGLKSNAPTIAIK
ncbi:MAG TPA: hypothetical protein VEU62_00070, partial [Bryobacterales bacterium]|nr:hypothetical protein [Bryobacterales bacterium]